MQTTTHPAYSKRLSLVAVAALASLVFAAGPVMAQKKPNIVMLMTDDTGWNDFGAYTGGGAALGHPTPNIDRIAKEGAVFTSWSGELHGGPRLVHDRAHPDPLGALDRGGPG
jgi:Sulfatase